MLALPDPLELHAIGRALAALPDHERRARLGALSSDELQAMTYCWPIWARPDQLAPAGVWRVWLMCSGRAAGKTRAASEYIRSEVECERHRHIGIIAPTSDMVRRVCVEGISGILNVSPPWCKPSFEPSTRRIVWPNGAIAYLFSGEEVDRVRGANLSLLWIDELCSFANPQELFDLAQMALRLPALDGGPSRCVISTTPKPIPLLKSLIADPSTVVTKARTLDNAANLDDATLAYLVKRYQNTRLGRQELDAELLTDVEGALWSIDMIERTRIPPSLMPPMKRVVVAIDPAGSTRREAAETGIIVAGIGVDGDGYVFRDLSGRMSPENWARVAVNALSDYSGDRIIAEQNFGGDMVTSTIRAVAPHIPVKIVRASRGKALRAEPVAALFEQSRAHIVGSLPTLEAQLCEWQPLGDMPSPDRLDALTWGLTELMLGEVYRPARFTYIDWYNR